jgi:hypothetical protein
LENEEEELELKEENKRNKEEALKIMKMEEKKKRTRKIRLLHALCLKGMRRIKDLPFVYASRLSIIFGFNDNSF